MGRVACHAKCIPCVALSWLTTCRGAPACAPTCADLIFGDILPRAQASATVLGDSLPLGAAVFGDILPLAAAASGDSLSSGATLILGDSLRPGDLVFRDCPGQLAFGDSLPHASASPPPRRSARN